MIADFHSLLQRALGVDRPRALDLFCGGGGVAEGLIAAGFDVDGIDIKPHPNYPGRFKQADVFDCDVSLYDYQLIWASPPCQKWSIGTGYHRGAKDRHPDLIRPTRELIRDHPYTVIENVPLAPLRHDLTLTGPMFGLRHILRKRIFELSWFALQPVISYDRLSPEEGFVTITKSLSSSTHWYVRKAQGKKGNITATEARKAMGIKTSMTCAEVGEAIPPAYAEFIARRAIEHMMTKTDDELKSVFRRSNPERLHT